MFERFKKFLDSHRILILLIILILFIFFICRWLCGRSKVVGKKIKGGDPDISSVAKIGDKYYSCLGSNVQILCHTGEDGAPCALGIPLLNQCGLDYMISMKNKVLNEGIIVEMGKNEYFEYLFSQPCVIIFGDDEAERHSTIRYLFGENPLLIQGLMQKSGTEGCIDFMSFMNTDDTQVNEKMTTVYELYINFFKRLMTFDDDKISLAAYIGQVGGQINSEVGESRKIIGEGLVLESGGVINNVPGIYDEVGDLVVVDGDGDGEEELLKFICELIGHGKVDMYSEMGESNGAWENEEEEEEEANELPEKRIELSRQTSFNRGVCLSTQAYYNLFDKSVRDWYKKDFSFYSQFLKKYSLGAGNDIVIEDGPVTKSEQILKYFEKEFFEKRICKKNKSLIDRIAGGKEEEIEVVKKLLYEEFGRRINDGGIKEKVDSVWGKINTLAHPVVDTTDDDVSSDDGTNKDSQIEEQVMGVVGIVADLCESINNLLNETPIIITYNGSNHPFQYINMQKGTALKMYGKWLSAIESNNFDVADVYPAQKVILFVLYICNYLYKSESLEELEEFKKELAAFMIIVHLFNSFCACYMGKGWNRRLKNEYVYNYFWKGMSENVLSEKDQLVILLGKKVVKLITDSEDFKAFLRLNSLSDKNICLQAVKKYINQNYPYKFSIHGIEENYDGNTLNELIQKVTGLDGFFISEYFSTAVNCSCDKRFFEKLTEDEVMSKFEEKGFEIRDDVIEGGFMTSLYERGWKASPTSEIPFYYNQGEQHTGSAICALTNITYDVDVTGINVLNINSQCDVYEPNEIEMEYLLNYFIQCLGEADPNEYVISETLKYYDCKVFELDPLLMPEIYLLLVVSESDQVPEERCWIGVKKTAVGYFVFDSREKRPILFGVYANLLEEKKNQRIKSVIKISESCRGIIADVFSGKESDHQYPPAVWVKQESVILAIDEMGLMSPRRIMIDITQNEMKISEILALDAGKTDALKELYFRHIENLSQSTSGLEPGILLCLNFSLLKELMVLHERDEMDGPVLNTKSSISFYDLSFTELKRGEIIHSPHGTFSREVSMTSTKYTKGDKGKHAPQQLLERRFCERLHGSVDWKKDEMGKYHSFIAKINILFDCIGEDERIQLLNMYKNMTSLFYRMNAKLKQYVLEIKPENIQHLLVIFSFLINLMKKDLLSDFLELRNSFKILEFESMELMEWNFKCRYISGIINHVGEKIDYEIFQRCNIKTTLIETKLIFGDITSNDDCKDEDKLELETFMCVIKGCLQAFINFYNKVWDVKNIDKVSYETMINMGNRILAIGRNLISNFFISISGPTRNNILISALIDGDCAIREISNDLEDKEVEFIKGELQEVINILFGEVKDHIEAWNKTFEIDTKKDVDVMLKIVEENKLC